MSSSPFKRKPDGKLFSLLSQRRETLRVGTNPAAASRNPAWCRVYGNGTSLPDSADTFESVYRSSFKPAPILKSVTIKNGGDFGLIMEAEVTIQCHTRDDFLKVENNFLHPGQNIRIEFGYGLQWPKGYQESINLSGFKVATYSFNTTAEGHYIATFKAMSPGAALRSINLGMTVERDTTREYKGESKPAVVTGIPDLVAFDSQINGKNSVDDMDDGDVVPIKGGKGAMVIYHPDHLHGKIANLFGAYGATNGVTETDNIVYMTLGYVVDRLINGEILKQFGKIIHPNHQVDFKKLAVKFDDKLSKSYVDNAFRSAWPTSVLFLGKGRGDYKNDAGNGKNFETAAKENPLVMCIKKSVGSRLEVDLKNILLERSVVFKALEDSYSEKQVAATNDIKESTEGLISLDDFFKKLFNEISKASGGMIKLRLSQHPDIHKGEPGNLPYGMYIFDENNGNADGPLQCWTFDPLDGDGSIRSCNLTSGAGSKEYQGAMFAGQMKNADPVQECCGNLDDGNTDGRQKVRDEAKEAMLEILYTPGTLADSKFDGKYMKSLESSMGALRLGAPEGKSYDMLMYPGLGISVEMDGTYGFLPGNAITTTQLPPGYNDAKAYFFVESVSHKFDGESSDWATTLEGKLSFTNNIQYLP